MKRAFTPDFFNDIYCGAMTSPEFAPLLDKVNGGAHFSNLKHNHAVNERVGMALYTTLLAARQPYTGEDWKALFECVDGMGVVVYYHAFLEVAEHLAGRVFATPKDLQDFLGLAELEPTEGTFHLMLQYGEIWDNRKHAEARISHVFYPAKAYSYIQMVDTLFRDGQSYNDLLYLQPFWEPWHLPDDFPFGGEWYNKHKSLVYGLCLAFDLFVNDTPIDRDELCLRTAAPMPVIEEAIGLRVRVLSKMRG